MGASVLAGGILIGFASLSSLLILRAKVDRLDIQIESALRRMGRLSGVGIPRDVESLLARELGLGDETAVALQLLDASGAVLFQSENWPTPLRSMVPPGGLVNPVELPPFNDAVRPRGRPAAINLGTQRSPEGRWRVGTILTPRGQGTIAVSLIAMRQEMGVIRRMYVLTIPGALVLIAGGAWWLSGRSLQPVDRLSQSISQITARGLDQRMSTAGIDQEFSGLVQSFNAMLERLERSFHQASRFSGDAAHELKTPLAILQGELERSIQRAETGSPTQQTLNHLLEEVRRLSGIVRKLLLLSLADAGQMALRQEPVNLDDLLEEQLEDVALLAPDLDVSQKIESNLVVGCDRDLTTQVIQNLLSNAVKYNQHPGWIRIQAYKQHQQVTLTIANASRALTEEERSHLFDRFYRGDDAHNRQTDGLGLGLSLSREIVRAHGGELSLADSPPEEVRFSLWLPGVRNHSL